MVRDFLAKRCRILAVVDLHGNTFKPHTGTKTSVLFVQKWNDDPKAGPLCRKKDDYNIFFATQRRPGKDTSGDKIFVKRPVAAVCDRRNWNGKNGGHRPPRQDEMALREVPDTYKTGAPGGE